MDISISDIQSYLRCRRQWSYVSPNRLALRKIGVPAAPLHIGSAVHYALAEAAKGNDVVDAIGCYFDGTVAEFRENYRVAVGVEPSEEETAPILEARTLVRELIRRYLNRYGLYQDDEPLGKGFRIVAVEQTAAVPIPGTDGTFKLTLDRIVRDDKGRAWVGEIKTWSKRPDLDKLRVEPQFVAYVWAASAILGEPIEGVLYDGLSTKLPKVPALLKSGRLSEAYQESTDYQTFCDTIDLHQHDFHAYDKVLALLKQRDAEPVTPFYARWAIRISQAQIDDLVSWLPQIHDEMAGNPAIIPNRPIIGGCWDCHVKDLCDAQTFGMDVDWLIKTKYAPTAGSQSLRLTSEPVEADAAMFA